MFVSRDLLFMHTERFSRTSTIHPGFSPDAYYEVMLNTIAARDKFIAIGIVENLVMNYNG